MVLCVVQVEVGLGWCSSLASHDCQQAWKEGQPCRPRVGLTLQRSNAEDVRKISLLPRGKPRRHSVDIRNDIFATPGERVGRVSEFSFRIKWCAVPLVVASRGFGDVLQNPGARNPKIADHQPEKPIACRFFACTSLSSTR
jgi:hypothetical protein